MKKKKILFILHLPPPAHGAAKVGEFISQSINLKNEYSCLFIPINSSKTIDDIGRFSFRKLALAIDLFIRILFSLLFFRPQKIYFTASIKGTAFYRDLVLSCLWKLYGLLIPAEVYYHYHTKGINDVVLSSRKNLLLTRFFLRKSNLILLSPLLLSDFRRVKVYKNTFTLSNGTEDPFTKDSFKKSIDLKYEMITRTEALYLSHMHEDKGYDKVLDIAKNSKNKNIHFNFAGNWHSKKEEEFFYSFIKEHNLGDIVTYHGYVEGKKKDDLFNLCHLLIYPSSNDAFPLTIIESLSYGVPVLATNQGSIPYILDENSGVVVYDNNLLLNEFHRAQSELVNKKTAIYSHQRFLEKFTLKKFETSLLGILND